MARLTRRTFLGASAALVGTGVLAGQPLAGQPLAAAEPEHKPPRQRPNILYGLSTGSWGRVAPPGRHIPLLTILDETAAGGFNGVRLTGFPDALTRDGLSVEQYGDELAKRGLKFSTVSFGGEYCNRDKHAEIRERARFALAAHQKFGANAMVFFPPGVVAPADEATALRDMFAFVNELGKMAIEEYGVRMGLHNHTDSLIENQSQVDRFLEGTDPRYVFCAWDSAHLHLGGCDVVATYKKSIDRLVYTDFKDATRMPVADDYLSPNGERFAGDSHSGKVLQLDVRAGPRADRFSGPAKDAGGAQLSGLGQSRSRHHPHFDRRELAGVDELHHRRPRSDLPVTAPAARADDLLMSNTTSQVVDAPGNSALEDRPWRLVLLLAAICFLAHFNRVSMAVAADLRIMGQYGISTTAMGTVYSSFLVVYTLAMIPGGWLIDHRGPRFSLAVVCLGSATIVALTGAIGLTVSRNGCCTSSIYRDSLVDGLVQRTVAPGRRQGRFAGRAAGTAIGRQWIGDRRGAAGRGVDLRAVWQPGRLARLAGRIPGGRGCHGPLGSTVDSICGRGSGPGFQTRFVRSVRAGQRANWRTSDPACDRLELSLPQ